MPLFVCENCHAIDNTGCGGTYWVSKAAGVSDGDEKALCVECAPTEFADGSRDEDAGKWHDLFPKVTATTDIVNERGRDHFLFTAGF